MSNRKVLIDALKKLGSAKAPTQKKDIIVGSNNPTQMLSMKKGGSSVDKKLSVKKSNIQGKGLFIDQPIRKGEIIGLAHLNNQATPVVGKYHNHSEDSPTAVNISKGNKRYLVAARDLPAGTEITTNYRLQPELEQPEDFMQKGGMTPQKDGYRTYSPFKNLPFIDVETDTIDTDNIVYDLQLRANNGVTKNVQKNTGLHKIPGATVIREIPMGRKGGSAPKLPRKKNSKGYSRSLEATNKFFAQHAFFAKQRSRKNKIYDPNAKYYQDGGDLPSDVSLSYLQEGERSYYDPILDSIYLNPNAPEEELNHEMAHAWQNRNDLFRSDPYSPKLRPSAAASDEQAATYFNRIGDDVDRYFNNLNTIVPELGGHTWNADLDRFIPDQIKYDKEIDPLMYRDPSTLEGEAEYMSQVYGRPALGIKQNGGASSPEEWEQQIRSVESQIGNPADWTMDDYYLLQDKLNAYRDWRENTPEGQAVIDSHNEEGEYDIPLPEHLQDYTNAMMKSKLAYANEFGNPAAKRMINIPDNPYDFGNGMTGTHYMSSMDNYAVPQIQDENGQLMLGDYGPDSREAMRFDSDEDANYFAEHYKDVSPGFMELELTPEEIEQYAKGGYVIEDISIPSLTKAQGGGLVKYSELIPALRSLTPGNALRATLYRGINPASYDVMEKAKGFPKEIFNTTFNNETRPFRVGMSLKYGTPEFLNRFLATKRITPQEYAKMPDSERMMLHDEGTREMLQDIGRRRLDAWAVGLKQPQEYNTLDQVGDNTYRMKDINYTPDFFSERYADIQAQGLKDRGYSYGEENPLVTIARQHYDRTPHPFIQLGNADNFIEQELFEKYQNAPRSYVDEALGWPLHVPIPWTQMRHAGMSTINQDPSFKYSVWDNDSYGVMGGYRWDVAKNPEGMHWQANDLWDINPWERRGSPYINQNDVFKKLLHANYFKPLQNVEVLGALGGKPFNIQNNFLIDPVTFKPLKQWQNGGPSPNEDSMNYAQLGGAYELGDEVDETTMKKLKKLGYTFEKI